MAVTTVFALVYIELQVEIYDLGYQGENRKSEVQKLMDDNGYVVSNICQLKSAHHLGVQLLTDNSHLRFLDNNHIVKLEMPAPLLESSRLVNAEKAEMNHANKKSSLWVSIFSLKSQAEAEPIK